MTETILPHELPDALDRAQGAKVLSLDCFDTLLWRDCHAPSDVFEALPGIVPGQRAAQEVNARKAEAVLRGRNEVSIEQIYGQVLPNADARQRANAIDAELAAEASACFAFGPTVQLMRTAKANGLKVIIVSDTYFDERQLRDLIAAAAGQEVADLIDRFFASSTAGVSKSQGMLAKVLKAIKCRPCEVLHIGDNRSADYDGARALGIPALHLVQFSEATKQRLRFERTCQQLIGDARGEIRGLQPHRALLSKGEAEVGDPAEALGFSVLGPVFHAYEAWLQEEAAALQRERGGTVHWLFLLRDGHLPHAVHCLGASASSAHRVEISRFTATAASLTTNEAIDRHIALEHGLNPSTLARQMLFTEQEIEQVCGGRDMAQASQALLAELRSGQRKKLIKRRAREQSARLAEHVRSTANPAPGDTLMLVDLGYNGSAQNRIDAFLSETFDVHVAGRYLLLREMAATGHDKKGLIDQRHFDPQMLEAMCGNVAVLEQLATTTMGSVTNYTSAGEPIRKESAVKGKQSQVRDRVQAGCLSFCKQALSPPVIRVEEQTKQRGWRDAAASSLTRFMFLPQAAELGVVKSFEHDVNLGSERMVALFDPSVAKEGMRRRGLFYMKGSSRMYLPAELASEDMNTRLSLLAQKRFGLSLSYSDQAAASLEIPTIYLGADKSAQTRLSATPTHDGYFAIRAPISQDVQSVALQMGAECVWWELASITRSPVATLKGGAVNEEPPAPVDGVFDAMTEHAPGLFECTTREGLVMITPPALGPEPEMIEMVFRPILKWSEVGVATAPHLTLSASQVEVAI